jgi:hypothetical protein
MGRSAPVLAFTSLELSDRQCLRASVPVPKKPINNEQTLVANKGFNSPLLSADHWPGCKTGPTGCFIALTMLSFPSRTKGLVQIQHLQSRARGDHFLK